MRADIGWNEVKSLLTACGAEICEGRGSRVRVVLDRRVLNLHSPHPGKELKKYATELVRDFLEASGVTPDE
ncbi:type II toxin-antitoxin system HicA family toxin [Desulfonema magnum]|uniref:Interferase domain-containing protein n=1 Tax=Desulfonema magnum TaxID=45655 RepID=A0A975BJ56_9BACT|nr:Interferase domain-containing protein [Desulfonema magnum]